jgi:hypothetical protein
MKATLTLTHEDGFYLREFVQQQKQHAESALQAVSDDSYFKRNTLRAVKDLLASARFTDKYLHMSHEGHPHVLREACQSISAAARRARIRCWHVLEKSDRDHEDRAIEKTGGA